MLAGENLTKSFGCNAGIDDITVKVSPGTVVAVIGPSGSGKTTLLRALSFVDPPEHGAITVDGHSYHFPQNSMNPSPPWPQVTAVFQQLFLWPHLTLRNNILLPVRKQPEPETYQRLSELIETLGMSSFIDRYPNQTSLGQRQRAALARALILKPSYVLLDEITSALDLESTSAVLNHIRLMCERGVGFLIITHSVGVARRVADRLLFLDHGKVVDEGGQELIERPTHPRIKEFLAYS